MSYQSSFTFSAEILPGHRDALENDLIAIGQSIEGNNSLFHRMNGSREHIHFARWMILEEKHDLDGAPLPERLVYNCFLDQPKSAHVDDLVKFGASDLDRIYRHCEGYPGLPTEANRLSYFQSHEFSNSRELITQTFYVNKIGRTVAQVRREGRLREALEGFLDSRTWDGMTATQVRESIITFIGTRQDLKWALRAEQSILSELLGQFKADIGQAIAKGLDRTVDGLKFLAKMPAIPAEPNAEKALRLEETETVPLSPEQLEQLDERDFHGAVHSPFSATGLAKRDLGSQFALPLTLTVANFGTHHLFGNSDLAGIKTIHFACWIFIDDTKRVLFFSNYDGSLENYNSDFIDITPWGLNLIFGNGVGYPPMNTILSGGAEHELKFRHFLRNRQLVAPIWVWYSAYPELTALNMKNNEEIRKGLVLRRGPLNFFSGSMSESDAQDWLRKL